MPWGKMPSHEPIVAKILDTIKGHLATMIWFGFINTMDKSGGNFLKI